MSHCVRVLPHAVVAVPGQPGGGFANYLLVTPDLVAHKPATVGYTHMVFERGEIQRGQRVLVLGASGGVGTFAVQFAHWAGAEVWGTASTSNLDLVRSLGATPIDYTAGLFEEAVGEIDLVVDTQGSDAQVRVWRTLMPTGALISVAAPPRDPEGTRRGEMAIVQRSTRKAEQLAKIATLLANGTIQVVIGAVMPFEAVQQALTKSASGHARGKIILDLTWY